MARKKRNLFLELSAGIRAMRDHAEGKIELRTTLMSASPTALEDANSSGRRRGCSASTERRGRR